MQKILLIFGAIAVIISSSVAQAQAQRFSYDGFSYEIIDETHVKLLGLVKESSGTTNIIDPKDLHEIVVPYQIETPTGTYIVSSINQLAFNGCEYLKNLKLADGEEPLGFYASSFGYADIENFYQGRNLNEYRKENLSFGRNESALKSLVIGKYVTSVLESQFADCYNLENVKLGENIETIDRAAFYNCKNVKNVNLPQSVKKIGPVAFSGCELLEEINIPEGVATINAGTFSGCKSISTVVIHNSIESIANSAFSDCETLSQVIIEDGIEPIWIDEVAFSQSYNIQSIYWGRNFDRPLQFNLGGEKSSLSKLIIGDEVTIIHKKQFYNCKKLKEVEIGRSLALIGENAFEGCDALNSLTILAKVPPVYGEAPNSQNISIRKAQSRASNGVKEFSDEVYKNCVLKVFESVLSVYESMSPWNNFQNIEGIEDPDMVNVRLDQTEIEMNIGDVIQIIATVTPESIEDKTVEWSTSNASIATVDDNGLVTAAAEGEAVITAACGDITATCNVTVSAIEAESVILNKSEIELEIGETYVLTATINPDNTTYPDVTWSSLDEKVATVDDAGKVMAVGAGEAVITATCGNVSSKCNVKVIETSGIDGIEGDGVTVTAAAGVITVKDAAVGSTVEVYNMSGVCIAAKTVESSVEEFPVAASGIYMVRAGGKTFKVVLL